MGAKKIAFDDQDIKADGKDAFKKFYKENRPDIFPGEDGVEFPILFSGKKIYQGAGVILSFLAAGDRLTKFITRSDLSHGWINGLNIHAASFDTIARDEQAFLEVIDFLHSQGLMIQLEADGRNPKTLKMMLDKGVISRLKFYLRGPASVYGAITGMPLDQTELMESLSLLNDSFEYQILLPVAAFVREDGQAGYLTPQEAADAARLAAEATNSKKHPFFIQPGALPDELNIDPLASSAFFKYRTQCRRHMVQCEIMKP